MLGLFAAFVASLAFQDVKKLVALGEPEWRLVFYFTLYSAIFSLCAMPFIKLHSHTVSGVLLLSAVAVFGTLGQLAVSRAYGHGNVLLSASLQYSGVIFSAFWGMALWREHITWQDCVGILVIIAAGVASSVFAKKTEKGFSIVTHKSEI